MLSLQQMSLSGAVMIAVITLMRAIFAHKLPKRTFVLLWGLVAVRLLMPYYILADWCIDSSVRPSQSTQKETTHTETVIPAFSLNDQAQQESSRITRTEQMLSSMAEEEQEMRLARREQSASRYLQVIWIVGMIVIGGMYGITYIRYVWIFKTSIPVQNAFTSNWLAEHPMRRKLTVRRTDRIQSPMTYGIFQPVILVPNQIDYQNEKPLKYVFEHEYTHIRYGDTVFKKLLLTALCVHWFNPAVWLMCFLCNRDIEMACDEQVVLHFGMYSRKDYATMLVEIAEQKNTLLTLYSHFGRQAIEERVEAIMKVKKFSGRSIVIAGVLIAGVFCGLAVRGQAQSDGDKISDENDIGEQNQDISIKGVLAGQKTEKTVQANGNGEEKIETPETADDWFDEEMKRQVLEEAELGNLELLETRNLYEQVDVGALSGTIELDCYQGNYYICRFMVDTVEIWSTELDFVHSGEKGIYLTNINGKGYILVNIPYQIQGSGNYRYQIFTFDQDGKKELYEENGCDFDYMSFYEGQKSTLLSSNLEAYVAQLQVYLQQSTLLVETRNSSIYFETDLTDAYKLFEESMPLLDEKAFNELNLREDSLEEQLTKIEQYYKNRM